MTITRETIAAKLAEMDLTEQRAKATLHAVGGAREMLAALTAVLDMPEPEPGPEPKPKPTT
jgi:hypothetical protein